jgi:hypothetical protein
MHGRIAALSALIFSMAVAAPTARADVAPATPVARDGLITSIHVTTDTSQTFRVRTLQPLGSGGTATTATSDLITVRASTDPQDVVLDRSLPVTPGGQYEVVGATGATTVTATIAEEIDGDGESLLDGCSRSFPEQSAPCHVWTVGGPLALMPDPRGGFAGGGGNALQVALAPTNGAVAQDIPYDGVITRWRIRSSPSASDTVLEAFHPVGRDQLGQTIWQVTAESAPVHVASTDVVTVAAAMPVRQGDVIGARSVGGELGPVAYVAGERLSTNQPPATLHGNVAWQGLYADRRLLVQADVETDVDGDGRGDASQDRATVTTTVRAPAEVMLPDPVQHDYTFRNAGPDAAVGVHVRFSSDGPAITPPASPPAGVTCTFDLRPWVDCTIKQLPAGASVTIAPEIDEPSALAVHGVTTVASIQDVVTPGTVEGDASRVSASTRVSPYVPNLPPARPIVAPACAHVVKGTRDDDVVRGTVFGDRLVGSDGGDLLKGGGGDDCLEGGSGNDVLDGGDGNDRLAGASGRDRLAGGTGDDKLTGGKGNDRLSGGPGNDTLSPGDGRDAIDAGAGNDTINAVDGVRETVECGAGRDTVRADKRDRLRHCEKVTRRT